MNPPEEVEVQGLVIPEYQRIQYEKHVRWLVKNWDPDAVEVLKVSRRADGRNYVVNGQQTAAAARVRGIEVLWAQVYTDLTLEREAELFGKVNTGQKKVNPDELFHAALVEGREPYVSIHREMENRGLKLKSGGATGHTIQAVRVLLEVHSRYGLEVTCRMVDVCTWAWGADSTSFHMLIMKAVGGLIGGNPLTRIDDRRLAEKISLHKSDWYRSRARDEYGKDPEHTTQALEIRKLMAFEYNKRLHPENRIA